MQLSNVEGVAIGGAEELEVKLFLAATCTQVSCVLPYSKPACAHVSGQRPGAMDAAMSTHPGSVACWRHSRRFLRPLQGPTTQHAPCAADCPLRMCMCMCTCMWVCNHTDNWHCSLTRSSAAYPALHPVKLAREDALSRGCSEPLSHSCGEGAAPDGLAWDGCARADGPLRLLGCASKSLLCALAHSMPLSGCRLLAAAESICGQACMVGDMHCQAEVPGCSHASRKHTLTLTVCWAVLPGDLAIFSVVPFCDSVGAIIYCKDTIQSPNSGKAITGVQFIVPARPPGPVL